MTTRFPCGRLCCALTFLSAMWSSATAQEWTRFRGPNGSGVSDAKKVPVKWTESEINWKTKERGRNYFPISANSSAGTR